MGCSPHAVTVGAVLSRPHPGLSGHGIDLVEVSSFAAQLSQPGSVFGRVFTDAEWSYCHSRPGHEPAPSLAARWAAKEAFVKAWSNLIAPHPPAVNPDTFPWHQVEVVVDAWGRPDLRLGPDLSPIFAASIATVTGVDAPSWRVAISLTHDGGWAAASALITVPSPFN